MTTGYVMDNEIKSSFEHLETIINYNYKGLKESFDKLERKLDKMDDDFIAQGKEIAYMKKDIESNQKTIHVNKKAEEGFGRQFDSRLSKVENLLLRIIIAGGLSGAGVSAG